MVLAMELQTAGWNPARCPPRCKHLWPRQSCLFSPLLEMNVIYLQEPGPVGGNKKGTKTISCEGGLRIFSLGGLSKTFWNANARLNEQDQTWKLPERGWPKHASIPMANHYDTSGKWSLICSAMNQKHNIQVLSCVVNQTMFLPSATTHVKVWFQAPLPIK